MPQLQLQLKQTKYHKPNVKVLQCLKNSAKHIAVESLAKYMTVTARVNLLPNHTDSARYQLTNSSEYSNRYTRCLKINRTPKTFYYSFAKVALISIKIGTHDLHMT